MAASTSSVSVAPQMPGRRIFGVGHHAAGHLAVGGGMHEGVAQPFRMGEDGHLRSS